MTDPSRDLEPFVGSWATALTTFKRDGTRVTTPVNLAVEGDVAFFRTYDKAWKTKRIRNYPVVEIAPATRRGKPVGPAVTATARLLVGAEEEHACRVLATRYAVMHRVPIPFAHRVARYTTMHYQVMATR